MLRNLRPFAPIRPLWVQFEQVVSCNGLYMEDIKIKGRFVPLPSMTLRHLGPSAPIRARFEQVVVGAVYTYICV